MIKKIISKCGKRHRPEIDMMEYIQNEDECFKNTGSYHPESGGTDEEEDAPTIMEDIDNHSC